MNQTQRRDEGLLYLTDDELVGQLDRTRRLVQQLNTIDRTDHDGIEQIVRELMVCRGGFLLNPPFFCDYGYNIEIGKNCLINYHCTFLDVGKIKLGDFCLIGPNVSIYAAGHPIHPAIRNGNYTFSADVTLGDNVWVGGSVVICPGVTIGDNAVIGAGSVVTHDIPAWTVAAGNPCRVIRSITEVDRDRYFKNRLLDDEVREQINQRIAGAHDPHRFPQTTK